MRILSIPFVIGLIFVTTPNLFGSPSSISAKREAHEDYRDLARRLLNQAPDEHEPRQRNPQNTAFESAVSYQKLDLSSVPNWQSAHSPIEAFQWVRDFRLIKHQGEMRRLSWLYPDDGCFARAELATQELINRFSLEPAKLFIFGNLRVKTANSPTGEVSWWYHVVPAFRSDKRIFVFDPAIQPQRPLLLEDWIQSMDQNLSGDFTLSICNSYTYSPEDDCYTPRKSSSSLQDQQAYLTAEQERLAELGKSADRWLKDLPPWRSKEEEKFICALNADCLLSRSPDAVKQN